MLFRETVAVYSEIHTQLRNTLYGQNTKLLLLEKTVYVDAIVP
jgi:hypothetical protein